MAVNMTRIHTDKAPGAIAPYSQGMMVGSPLTGQTVYLAGQIAMNPKKELIGKNVQEQTEQTINNMEAILKAQGLGLENIASVTVFLSDFKNFGKMNEVYQERFTQADKPARAVMAVRELPKGALVEMQAVAYKGSIFQRMARAVGL